MTSGFKKWLSAVWLIQELQQLMVSLYSNITANRHQLAPEGPKTCNGKCLHRKITAMKRVYHYTRIGISVITPDVQLSKNIFNGAIKGELYYYYKVVTYLTPKSFNRSFACECKKHKRC